MKFAYVFLAALAPVSGFHTQLPFSRQNSVAQSALSAFRDTPTTSDDSFDGRTVSSKTRKDVVTLAAATLFGTTLSAFSFQEPANARGFATLDQSYRRYAPRIRAGGEFYATELKSLVSKNDWAGIKNALAAPPDRNKADLAKPDAGVAERARLAGQFSDARVLVAADLFASAFSDASFADKTKRMKESVNKLRTVVESMQKTAKQGLGEDSSGFFGIGGGGGKKVPEAELAKTMRQLYVEGGNAWNEFVLVANEELPSMFDKFEYVK